MEREKQERVLHVLQRAKAGDVVDRWAAGSAIRDFEAMVEELNARLPEMRDPSAAGAGAGEEMQKMKAIIRYQEKKIKDMTHRLDNPAPQHQLPASGRDRSDHKLRLDLAADFNRIFDNQWRRAYTELHDHMHWTDVECLYSLMRVIRTACDLCYNQAADQVDKLLADMEGNMINPDNGNTGRLKQMLHTGEMKYTDGMEIGEKFALEYRQKRAPASVPALIDMFMDTKLRVIIDPPYMRDALRKYIEKCIEVIWLMYTLEPPMRIYWQKQTDRVQLDFFHFHGRSGHLVNQTVWPTLFIHNTGQLISQGYVLAM